VPTNTNVPPTVTPVPPTASPIPTNTPVVEATVDVRGTPVCERVPATDEMKNVGAQLMATDKELLNRIRADEKRTRTGSCKGKVSVKKELDQATKIANEIDKLVMTNISQSILVCQGSCITVSFEGVINQVTTRLTTLSKVTDQAARKVVKTCGVPKKTAKSKPQSSAKAALERAKEALGKVKKDCKVCR